MDQIVTLGIENYLFEIDWRKFIYQENYSPIFQKEDLCKIKSPYLDFDEDPNGKIIYIEEWGFKKPFKHVLDRLEMLGYGIKNIEKKYYEGSHLYLSVPDFNKFKEMISKIDIEKFIPNLEWADYDPGKYFLRSIWKSNQLRDYQFSFDDGLFLDNIDPLITLRLLGENSKYHDSNVVWRCKEFSENFELPIEKVYEPLQMQNKILIVTEGTTDLEVIKKAIKMLKSHISDFVYFVDMKNNYPFCGTGKMSNFFNGLKNIKIINDVIFIFDNDTTGKEHFAKIEKECKKIKNFTSFILPCHSDFTKFRTVGPEGEASSDINGKGVSIECFLDLEYEQSSEPIVRWTGYNNKLKSYQGVLEKKYDYYEKFIKISNDNSYNFKKLEFLLDHLMQKCSELKNYSAV